MRIDDQGPKEGSNGGSYVTGRKGPLILPTKEPSPGPIGSLQFLSQPTRFFVQPVRAFAFSTVSLPLLL